MIERGWSWKKKKELYGDSTRAALLRSMKFSEEQQEKSEDLGGIWRTSEGTSEGIFVLRVKVVEEFPIFSSFF